MLQCVGEAATVPDFDRASAFAQLLAFEQAKLDDTYKRAQELRDHAEAGEVAVSEPGRPPAGVAAMAVQLEMKDAQHRVETVREFLRQRA
ncbi:hypothetical protein DIPPA_20713 [Diplonema papillatum]|nr:hypothetical protein DIPPA_20713 [Diplonema papillatum]